jgi:hypothetical protein
VTSLAEKKTVSRPVAAAIGWGPDGRIAAAKRRARAGEPGAAAALAQAARDARRGGPRDV